MDCEPSASHIIAEVQAGRLPDADGAVTVLPQPTAAYAAVLAFTARTFVVADVDPDWVAASLPEGDLSAPLGPPFLSALSERTGRKVGNIDLVCLAETLGKDAIACIPGGLRETSGDEHDRVRRAKRYRDGVRVWRTDGGVLMLGYGLAGRVEVSVEVDPDCRGSGLGRALVRAARSLAAPATHVWAQIAPGNAASVRAFLAAGYVPVGAETLLVREAGQ